MYQHVIVPLDGSSFGEAALRPAFALARRTGAKVTLVTVADGWSAVTESLPDARLGLLERLARDHASTDVPVRVAVRHGHPTAEILNEAADAAADLVVMSTHGRGGVTRLWLGSVADQCLRHSSLPLLLVRPQPGALSSGEDTFLPSRAIVPLDGTAGSERALPRAIGMAQAFGIPVVLIRVLAIEEGLGAARVYLDGVAQRLWKAGVPATTRVLTHRHPADAILSEAGVDPVVMSTHARPPIARALIGSVADKVVRGSRGTVLLVPPPPLSAAQAASGVALEAGR